MYNENVNRWIKSSLAKHFAARLSPIFIEGQNRPINKTESIFEFRINGPDYKEITNTEYIITVNVNILINCIADEDDLYQIERLIGSAVKAFSRCINVYKYGDGELDDSTILGSFILSKNGTEVNNFGKITTDTRLMQSTVDGFYKMNVRIADVSD